MTNNRFGRGVLLAITTPRSLKVKDREIYYVLSSKGDKRYRVNFENKKGATCECYDQKRNPVCKHMWKIIAESGI